MAERLARHLSDRLGEDGGHRAPRQPLEGDAPRRRNAAEGGTPARARRDGVARARDRHRARGPRLPDRIAAPDRDAAAARRPIGPHDRRHCRRDGVFPTSRDDLIECAALLRSVRRGELDAIVAHDAPLDVLAQQIVAETACARVPRGRPLRARARRVAVPRSRTRASSTPCSRMSSEGFSTRRGRRAALIHRDEVNATVRGRRGARLLAQTSGGAIPEIADYRVILDPEDTFIGTLNEDFAIESIAGDIFQLGNASWRDSAGDRGNRARGGRQGRAADHPLLARRGAGQKRRAVAGGQRFARGGRWPTRARDADGRQSTVRDVAAWLVEETGLSSDAAEQAVAYLADGRRALGVIPSQDTLVLERFFDESGGMQLVLHAPFGSRVTKAWGLALRKRFCRQFNFELQAAATEDASDAVARASALVPAVGCVPLSASRDDARRAGAGVSRRTGLRDAVAVERDDFARRSAHARRAQARAAGAADARRRSAGLGLPRCRRVSREHPRRPSDSRSSARRADGS